MLIRKTQIELKKGVTKDLYINGPSNLNYQTILNSEMGLNYLKNCFISEWERLSNSPRSPYWDSCQIEFMSDLTSMYNNNVTDMNFIKIQETVYLVGFSNSIYLFSKKILRVLPVT